MLKFVLYLLVMLLGIMHPGKAQVLPDSADAAAAKTRFVFNFDARYTLLQNNPARIGGLKAGLEFKKRYRAGIGLYALSDPLITALTAATPDQKATERQLKFRYSAIYGEYVLLKTKRWELSTPVQLGFGKTRTQYFDNQQNLLHTKDRRLWLIEPSVAGHFKVYSWVGLGAGAGYRHALNYPSLDSRQLNAPIYYVRLKLFVGEMYRAIRAKYPCPKQ